MDSQSRRPPFAAPEPTTRMWSTSPRRCAAATWATGPCRRCLYVPFSHDLIRLLTVCRLGSVLELRESNVIKRHRRAQSRQGGGSAVHQGVLVLHATRLGSAAEYDVGGSRMWAPSSALRDCRPRSARPGDSRRWPTRACSCYSVMSSGYVPVPMCLSTGLADRVLVQCHAELLAEYPSIAAASANRDDTELRHYHNRAHHRRLRDRKSVV